MDFSDKFNESQGLLAQATKLASSLAQKARTGNAAAGEALARAGVKFAQSDWAGAIAVMSSFMGAPAKKSLAGWSDDVIAKSDFVDADDATGALGKWSEAALAKADGYAVALVGAHARSRLNSRLCDIVFSTADKITPVTDADIDVIVSATTDDILVNGSFRFREELRSVLKDKGYDGLKAVVRAKVPAVLADIERLARQANGRASLPFSGV